MSLECNPLSSFKYENDKTQSTSPKSGLDLRSRLSYARGRDIFVPRLTAQALQDQSNCSEMYIGVLIMRLYYISTLLFVTGYHVYISWLRIRPDQSPPFECG